MKKYVTLFLIIIIFQLSASPLFAESDIGASELIEKINKIELLMNELNEKQHAELLSPDFFKKLNSQINRTKNLIKNGEELLKINDSIKKANNLLEKVNKSVEQGRLTYKHILEKRETLISRYNSESFLKELKNADEEINDGGEEIEDGDLKEARVQAKDIIEALFKAEVAGVLEYYLKPIEKIEVVINKSHAKNNMPKNFNKVKKCKSDLEEYIHKNPGEHNIINQKMNNCRDKWHKFQARLIFAEKVAANDWDNEDLIIYFDTKLDELFTANAKEADISLTVPEKADRLKAYIKKDSISLINLLRKIKDINQKLKEKESELTRLNDIEKSRKQIADKYNELRQMYNDKIAQVKIENNDIVIDIYGLTFKPGGFEITSKAFTLLEKIKNTILLFNENKIEIIGHTDSLGNARSNKILSKHRADTLNKYILSTGVISPNLITILGEGDNRPLKPNTTKNNRNRNRRVEIRIKDVISM